MKGGIDLGGTKVMAVVVGPRGKVLGEAKNPTPREGGPPAVAEAIAKTLREAAQQAGVETNDLQGVGVGSPGVVDAETGTVAGAGNLPDWEESFALAGALSDSWAARCSSATTSRWPWTASTRSVPAGRSSRCSGSGGAPAWAAGSSSAASPGWAAAPRARSVTWW